VVALSGADHVPFGKLPVVGTQYSTVLTEPLQPVGNVNVGVTCAFVGHEVNAAASIAFCLIASP
jgi:hypothetical protein